MIQLSKINGKPIVVNCELIELVDGGTDTVVTLTTGSKIVVQDPPTEIVRKVIEYRQAVHGRGVNLHVHPCEVEEIRMLNGAPGSSEPANDDGDA